jgi:hypothetical protein
MKCVYCDGNTFDDDERCVDCRLAISGRLDEHPPRSFDKLTRELMDKHFLRAGYIK